MQILHVITDLNTGGAESMLCKLVTLGAASRVRHRVVSLTDEGDFGSVLRHAGVPVHALGFARTGAGAVTAVAAFRKLCAREQPDVVQSWLYHADLIALAAKTVRRRVPIVWNVRSAFHHGLRRWPVRLCARLSRLPSAIVVNSEAGRRVHQEIGYRPRRWETIPNGFDTGVFRPDRGARTAVRRDLAISDQAVVIGLVARVDPLKDHRTFIAAASLLARRVDDVVFVLLGEGTDEDTEMSGWISAAGLAPRVRRLGKRADVARLTAAMDIATSSSIAEGFANVIGEAMACGVPCVVTDVGDSAAIVGATGIVVPAGNAVALASAWQRMVEWGAERRAEAGAAARTRVERLYSLDAVRRKYHALYEDLIG